MREKLLMQLFNKKNSTCYTCGGEVKGVSLEKTNLYFLCSFLIYQK